MDKSSIIGIILGFIAVGVGMVLKGVSPVVLVNLAAILIIIAGTVASLLSLVIQTMYQLKMNCFKIR